MVDVHVLLERIELAALVEQDLGQPVRREGRWLKWTCPFHADGKTPSLGVAGNRWKCFGCGRSGDAIDWTARARGIELSGGVRAVGCYGALPLASTMAHISTPISHVDTIGGVAGASTEGGEHLPVDALVRRWDQSASLAQPARA